MRIAVCSPQVPFAHGGAEVLAERLTEPEDPVIAANVRRLNELLFAPLDYALIARTAADA